LGLRQAHCFAWSTGQLVISSLWIGLTWDALRLLQISSRSMAQAGNFRPCFERRGLFPWRWGVRAGGPDFDGPFVREQQPAKAERPVGLIRPSCGAEALTPRKPSVHWAGQLHHQIGQRGGKPVALFGSESLPALQGATKRRIRTEMAPSRHGNPPELSRRSSRLLIPPHQRDAIKNRRRITDAGVTPVGVIVNQLRIRR